MKKNVEVIWLVLILLSIFAFLLGYLKLVNSSLVTALLVSTFIKGQLVVDYFMGLKEVKFKYRIIPTLWLSVVLSLVAVAYYIPVGKL
ncbi:cytochrome C oxidase subunit IV family protein [Sulfuricurvum sp.]|uniref:cytochrome C oxidase subunit IV family protein n=1 Tax=Sulfuricurvum sp. TaxID=2025608 RepID=UPI0026372BE8|nr:cytochrome C oxidase subunit IV family protein [Sulfuricurvum sp.]MDD2367825.1 cytochrome C oxidase subunit IV family protein [Sulfuricurvum sp.]MDD2951245.1 cytochrome C oxidase subunit IV family protein [Sulfuricurvum sp.]MDD4950309.1 cytochrome C oxidase subunit IV family protein [Sulfuricurvum sp.]